MMASNLYQKSSIISVDLTGFEQILSTRIMPFGNLSGLKTNIFDVGCHFIL